MKGFKLPAFVVLIPEKRQHPLTEADVALQLHRTHEDNASFFFSVSKKRETSGPVSMILPDSVFSIPSRGNNEKSL